MQHVCDDADIREFEALAGPLFDPVRLDMDILRTRITAAVKGHRKVDELQRRLVLYRCLQLVGVA